MVRILISLRDCWLFSTGLYGNKGIIPARWRLRVMGKSVWERLRDTPTLLWFGPWLGLDTQHCMEMLSLSGTLLSLAAMTVSALRDCRLYLVLWVLYLSLYQVTPPPHTYYTMLISDTDWSGDGDQFSITAQVHIGFRFYSNDAFAGTCTADRF